MQIHNVGHGDDERVHPFPTIAFCSKESTIHICVGLISLFKCSMQGYIYLAYGFVIF